MTRRAPENGPDANSTAYALMALSATGEDAAGEAWSVDGSTAVDFLLSVQQPDGSLEWQAGTGPNLLATAQAVTALMGQVISAGGRYIAGLPALSERRSEMHSGQACPLPARGQ